MAAYRHQAHLDATAGRLFFRRWSNQSLDALRRAAGSVAPADR